MWNFADHHPWLTVGLALVIVGVIENLAIGVLRLKALKATQKPQPLDEDPDDDRVL
jgi:hypothetical protein